MNFLMHELPMADIDNFIYTINKKVRLLKVAFIEVPYESDGGVLDPTAGLPLKALGHF